MNHYIERQIKNAKLREQAMNTGEFIITATQKPKKKTKLIVSKVKK